MRWLTLDFIKAHSRIDFDCEDDLLESYGESAEITVLNIIRRTYEDLLDEYGEVPAPIVQASLMLVDHSYQNRSPVTAQSLYAVLYTFDLLVKPYIKLS